MAIWFNVNFSNERHRCANARQPSHKFSCWDSHLDYSSRIANLSAMEGAYDWPCVLLITHGPHAGMYERKHFPLNRRQSVSRHDFAFIVVHVPVLQKKKRQKINIFESCKLHFNYYGPALIIISASKNVLGTQLWTPFSTLCEPLSYSFVVPFFSCSRFYLWKRGRVSLVGPLV